MHVILKTDWLINGNCSWSSLLPFFCGGYVFHCLGNPSQLQNQFKKQNAK